jgi:hypothetical protein
MIYVYRHFPVICRQMVSPGADNNIDVIGDGFKSLDEAYFIERHGGGKYGLTVKDTDNVKGGGLGYFEARLEIPWTNQECKLDLREVVWDDPKNKPFKAWARAKKLIDENDIPMSELQAKEKAKDTTSDNAAVMKMALDFVSRMGEKDAAALKNRVGEGESLGKAMGDMMLEKMKQDDPNKQVTTLTSLMQAMKSDKPDSGLAAIVPMFTALITSMQQSSDRNMAHLVEIMKANKPEPSTETPRDSISQLKDLLEVAKEIKGSNSSRGTAEAIIDKVGDAIPHVLSIIGTVMAMKAKQMGVTPPVEPAANVPESQINRLIRQNGNGEPQPVAPEETQMIRQFAPLILSNMGKEGWEFGAWISEGFGDMIAAKVAKQGPDKLLAGLKSIPELWAQLEGSYGEDYVKNWVISLCNYKAEMAKLEGEPDGPEAENE